MGSLLSIIGFTKVLSPYIRNIIQELAADDDRTKSLDVGMKLFESVISSLVVP